MLIATVWFSLQSASFDAFLTDQPKREAATDKWLTCVDEETKSYFEDHMYIATLSKAIDAGFAGCVESEKAAEALNEKALLLTNSVESAHRIATTTTADLKISYGKGLFDYYYSKLMLKPDFATNRANITVRGWRRCVIGRADRFSVGRDGADAVATAATAGCRNERAAALDATSMEILSRNPAQPISPSNQNRLASSMDKALHDVAVARVIEKRSAPK